MGLRLYQPPVESDIQSKPPADRSLRSRSTIRRILDRNDERLRERRRRVLAATTVYNPETRALIVTDHPLRRDPNRPPLDDRAVTMFGERWAHLHAESNPNLRDDDNELPSLQRMAVGPDFLARRSQPRPEPTYALSSVRSTQAPGHPSRRAARPQAPVWTRIDRRERSPLRGESRPSAGDSTDSPGPRLVPPSTLRWSADDGTRRHPLTSTSIPWTTEPADVDGLGDRNRSLSPEGDNVWDTLLTTLTPDPQPPSVGSSFASAAIPQSTAAASSSRTSFTTPDNAAEESAFEPPCESGCDNSDTEGEEEDEMEQMQLPYFPRLGGASSRSYADRARGGGGEDPLELLGGIGGMQRIVRNLARREDIPDEWWAEAGLSRTLSREAGN